MVALAPGVLLKLLDGMKSGATKPVGEHRRALLQVTDIVPVDLDEKDLWPKQGFCIKVSDSSHSIYATLPLDEDDLVLSNKMQLGQFIHVDRLDHGSPVPVIRGTKPLPGRRPLVGTQEPIVILGGKGGRTDSKAMCENGKVVPTHRRGSWVLDRNFPGILSSRSAVKTTTPEFKEGASGKNWATSLFRKSSASSKFPGNEDACGRERRIPESPFSTVKKNSTSLLNRLRGTPRGNSPSSEEKEKPTNTISKKSTRADSPVLEAKEEPKAPPLNIASMTPKKNTGNYLALPGKFGTIAQKLVHQKEAAQKVALQALRDASAAETLVRTLKMFLDLSSSARAEAPAIYLEQFLNFHQELKQAVADIEAVHAASAFSDDNESTDDEQAEEDDSCILHELMHNSIDRLGQANVIKRRTATLTKSVSYVMVKDEPKVMLGQHSRSSSSNQKADDSKANVRKGAEVGGGDENRILHCKFADSIKLAKQIQTETGIWFMEFLEAALEVGLKITRGANAQKESCCQHSLLLKIINWVEIEQNDSSERPVHPRAAHIGRKLRIKVKNPFYE